MVRFPSVSPNFEAADKNQLCRGMVRELKVVKVGANIEIPPLRGQIPLPPLRYVHKESIFDHHVVTARM